MTNLHNSTIFSKSEMETIQEKIFFEKPLGKIYKIIPFEKLAALFPAKKTQVGAKSWLKPEGCIALMILKHFLGLSDEKLIQRLNSDWEMQYFCGIQLAVNEEIRDTDLPSRVRKFIGENIDYTKMQNIFITAWIPMMTDIDKMLNDATAFESYIRFPTDVKLLWECCVYINNSIKYLCNQFRIKRPKSNFKNQAKKQTSYQKRKRKPYRLTQRRKKALLLLLDKLVNQIEKITKDYQLQFSKKIKEVKKIYEQQKYMFDNKENKVEDRIVSLFKTYIRPIVRGKENKAVEFGAKVTMSQVDGINIIEHLSFDAYNECKDLELSVKEHKKRFGECKMISGDKIYATNENRTFLSKENIQHNFIAKGRKKKYEEQKEVLRNELNKERATRLEGSFGNEKNHYSLRKIKARIKETEIIWIFFGVFTANCINISKRDNKTKNSTNEQKRLKV